jgi:hypothetical protein
VCVCVSDLEEEEDAPAEEDPPAIEALESELEKLIDDKARPATPR